MTPPLDLVGAGEAAQLLGVRTPNFVRDWSRRAGFPAPVATIGRGRVWRRDEVEAFRQRVGPRRGAVSRRLELSDVAGRWLPDIKRRIVRVCRPTRIVLFGSQARGEANAGSDIDLLVVLPADTRRRVSAADVRAAIGRVPIGVDVIVVTEADLERAMESTASVLRPALREGATIYVAR